MVKAVVALAVLAHGIGHVLFVANAWGYWKGDVGRPSFFTNVLHASSSVEGIVGILWLLPLVGFVAAAWGGTTVTLIGGDL